MIINDLHVVGKKIKRKKSHLSINRGNFDLVFAVVPILLVRAKKRDNWLTFKL